MAVRLDEARKRYARTTVAVFEGIFRSNDYATLSLELGMNVIMIAPDYSAERYTDEGFSVHVPAAFAQCACEALAIREADAARVSCIPGCDNVLYLDERNRPSWLKFVLVKDQVSTLLRALAPDLCFAGVEERFGEMSCRMRNERFPSDERGCDYGGFDGFVRYVRDLDIARDLAHWTVEQPRWLKGGGNAKSLHRSA